jgi:germination protein M
MKKRYQWLSALLIICMVIGLTGCQNIEKLVKGHSLDGDSEDKSAGYHIYYINKDETKLKAVSYQFVSTTEDGIIQECIEALGAVPDDKKYKAVLGENACIEDYSYDKDNRILSLYFDKRYSEISETTERLIRAAIVKTMTQFSGLVDYVSFNIDGEWLSDSSGNTLLMKNTDYVVEVTSNLDHLDDVTLQLYFVSGDGSGLTAVRTTMKYYNTSPVAYAVLDALIRGPVSEECRAVVSANTQIKSVYVKDGICQVDFNQGFLEKIEDQDFLLNLYGVVNSLTELDDVDKVQITVDGQVITDAPDGVTMTGYLVARPELIVQ